MNPQNILTNDLDRAILALIKSSSALPEFLRRLGEGELWFLIRHHPELDGGELELENGMASPFCEIADDKGPLVPIFSSFERLEEALQRAKVPLRTYDGAAMPARQLLEVLAKMEARTVLNKSCTTGEVTLSLDMMRDVADGSAFHAEDPGSGRSEEMTLNLIDPADYPTDLLQPVFEILRKHPQFRAAWILEKPVAEPLPPGGRAFQFLVHMEPRDAAAYHEFNMVLNSSCGKVNRVDQGLLDEGDADYLASFWDAAEPFYVAAGHVRPE